MAIAATAIALVAGVPAFAQLSGSNTTGTTGTCVGGNDADGFCGFSVGTQVNTGAQFKSRYAWNINADIGAFSTKDISGTSTHLVNVNATAPGGYRLDISTQRTGDLNRVTDTLNCNGSADTTGVTGTSNVALSSGSISLADPGSIGNGGSDTEVPFNQTSSGTIFQVSNGGAQTHNLTFTWNGAVRSNSCEAAVRQGLQNVTTTGCSACEYPGSPSRTDTTDGHFVTVSFTSLCGNGSVDGSVSEQCDEGSANGVFGSCCTTTCQFASSSTNCRTSAGDCDVAENCTGSSATCPSDSFLASTVTCRGAAGACDVAEHCTGTSAGCPADTMVPSTSVCRAIAGVCDLAENCPGNAPNCPADAKKSSGASCTSDGNPCTLDQCDGSNVSCQHPAGNGGASCRAAAGGCDVAETCTGTSTTCPADTLASSGSTCRAAAGVCDVAETCDGITALCPPDLLALPTVQCRSSAGVCDVAENCTGLSPNCPADLILPNGTSCSDGSSCTTFDKCQGGACVGTPTLDTCLDDFLCYKSRVTSGTARFSPIPSVHLVDHFEDQNFRVIKPKNLCTPADKHDGNGTVDPVVHLVSYKIRSVGGVHVRRVNLPVTNQLGTIHVDTIRPDLLLEPAGKSLVSAPAEPPFNSHAVDNYKCYKVRVTRGTTKFPITALTISDQFITPSKVLELRKVRHLCTPVDKNAELRKNPATHLLCYLMRVQKGQPKFSKRTGIYTHDQFGNLRLDASKEREFCIPSTQSPSGAFLDELDD